MTAQIFEFPNPQDREGRQPSARRSPLRSTAAPKCRRPVSHKATDWAWEQPVRGVRQHVLLALAERANVKTGKCTPSLGELATRTGLGESTIRGHIQALANAGLIDVKVTQGGRRQRSTYTMLISKKGNTPQELEGIADEETPQELRGIAPETPQLLDRIQPETPQELATNPPGAGPVVPNTRKREPGREAIAAAPPAAVDAGLFDEPVTPATQNRDRHAIATAITKRYQEAVPFSKYPAVFGVVKQALTVGGYSGEDVNAACLRLAGEGRSVTVDALRYEIEGFPRSSGSTRSTRAPLRERLKQGGAA